MIRDIKFRAWDDEKKQWLLGYEYSNLGGFSLFGECMLLGEWSHILNAYILNPEAYQHCEKDLRVMQFTGLHDKNGKEIYEGDIIRCRFIDSSDGHCHDIYFHNGDFRIRWTMFRLSELFDFMEDKESLEVIGNIYENPELLKS
jgi:uncharacterized phage protein (TIGR01671 family)